MPEFSARVGVVGERRAIDNPWVDHSWSAVAVLSGVPDLAPGTRIAGDDTNGRYYLGEADLLMATTETAQYRDNLLNPPPKLWVVSVMEPDGPRVTAVTADPSEGEAHTETGMTQVCVVPMPEEIAATLAEFVDTHHVERAFFKRKRKRYDQSQGEA